MDIVLIQKALDDTDFWTSVYQGGETAAEEYNVNLTVMGPKNEREVDTQNQMILDAIASKPGRYRALPQQYRSDRSICGADRKSRNPAGVGRLHHG